jgi:hypothetical protein
MGVFVIVFFELLLLQVELSGLDVVIALRRHFV